MEAVKEALSAQGLAVATFPGKGRGLVTTRDFYPGDVIICQEPFASAPSVRCCGQCFASSNLKKCSKCQTAWYCGSTCQKSEWKLHQLECQALVGLSENKRKKITSTMRLMIRLLLRKKLQREKVVSTTATDNYDLVKALVSHMSDLDEKQIVLYAQMANLIKLVLALEEVEIKEVTENFSRLACNAHTICDRELKPLGTGIYLIISIINHSCLPNSVLVFEGQTAVVRAVEYIKSGTEVVISYIETATTTEKRKKNLMEHYFFTCECKRCIGDNILEDATLEGYRCKDIKCDGALLYCPGMRSYKCQSCGLSQDNQELEKFDCETKKMSEKVSKCLAISDLVGANIFLKALEQLQSRVYHPHSIEVLKTREELMKVLIELKDWQGALAYCRLTIPIYQRVYTATHPLLGLQYYTCGKLEWFLGHTEDAIEFFTKAVDVLRISHGTSVPFMRDLLSKLEEARAEVAYKAMPADG